MNKSFRLIFVTLSLLIVLLAGCTDESTVVTSQDDHPQNLSVKVTVDAVYQGETQTKAFVEFFRQGKAVQFTGKERVYLQRTGDAQNQLSPIVSGSDDYYSGMVNITDGTYDFLYVSDDGQQWPLQLVGAMAPGFWFPTTFSIQSNAEFSYIAYVFSNPTIYTSQLKAIDGYVTDYTNRTIFGSRQDGSQATGPKTDINGLQYYTGNFSISPQATDINGQTGGLAAGGGTIGTFATVTYAYINTAWAAFNTEMASPIYDRSVTWTN